MQLFDVFARDREGELHFQMRAPLNVIAQVLDLRPDAVKRVEREANAEGDFCELHMNGRARAIVGDVFSVQRAMDDLEPEVEG